jgi:WD40 repeat protein
MLVIWIAALLLSFNDAPPITPGNVAQIEIVNRLELIDTSALAIAFNPLDSHELALAQSDGLVSIWDVTTGDREAAWQAAENRIAAIAYMPDAKYIVTMEEQGRVDIWDATSHERVHTLTMEDQIPSAFDTAPNNMIAIGYIDGNVRLWNADTGENISVLYGNNYRVRTLDISDDGRRIAFGYSSGTIFIYRIDNLEQGQVYIEQTLDADELNALIFHTHFPPNQFLGEIALVTISNFISAQFWDFQYSINLHSNRTDSKMAYPQYLTLNHEGSLLAVAGKYTTAGGWCEGNLCPVEIISAHYQQNTYPNGHPVLKMFDVPGQSPLGIVFSPDDRYLASSFSGGEIVIWGIPQSQ